MISAMVQKKVAVIYGGISSEREVSINTGKAIVGAVERLGFDAVPIEVTADLSDLVSKLTNPKVSAVVNGLHGRYAEDGSIQGILEYLKIPYTGSGVLASALAMNKIYSKEFFKRAEIPIAQHVVVRKNEVFNFKSSGLSVPVVVKPNIEGSSVGVTIVKKEEDVGSALSEAFKYDEDALIEKFIPGIEISVPVYFNEALEGIEIAPKSGFYDYNSKYTAGATEYFIPARTTEKVRTKVKELSLKAFKALGCRQYARVDFRVDGENPYILEVNTLPGCTETSLVPKALLYKGISFDEFIRSLIETARCDYF